MASAFKRFDGDMPPLEPHLLRPTYRPDIDGLRAIAVFSVIAFHAFPGTIPGGFTGVDVFFVISGYLISTIVFQNLDKGTFSFFEFYSRRIRRIFPALIVVLAASYALGWFALLPDEYRQLGKHIAAGAGFASNVELWRESGYFDQAADTKPLLHLWSLGIEEQFYIIWPLLLWLARNAAHRLMLTAVLVATSFYMNVSEVQKDVAAAFYFPQARFWELLCGAFLAWCALYRQDAVALLRIWTGARTVTSARRRMAEHDARVLSNSLSVAGLLFLACGFFLISKKLSFPGQWAVIPVLGAMLIIAAGPQAWLNRTVFSHRLAVWFGLISYPLYLWHWPLLSFVRIVGNEAPNTSLRIGAIGTSVALAWLTCRLVEGPIRLNRHGSAATAVLVVLMGLAGGVGFATYVSDGLGFRQRSILKGADVLAYYEHLAQHYHVCTPASLADEALRWEGFIRCMQSKPGADVEIALVGDSHAEHLFLGLADALPARNVVFYIKGAPAFSGRPEFQDIFKYVIASKSITHVILTMFWEAVLPQVPDGSSLDKELSPVIEALTRAGKIVYLTDDIPYFPFTASECKRYRWFAWKNLRCEVSRQSEMRRYERYIAALRTLTRDRTDVKLLETMKYFCDDISCSMIVGNDLLYRDAHHLSIAGSRFIGRKIVEDNVGVFK